MGGIDLIYFLFSFYTQYPVGTCVFIRYVPVYLYLWVDVKSW